MWNNNGNWCFDPSLGAQARRRSVVPPGAPALWLDGDDIDGQRNSTLVNGQALASWINKGSLGGSMDQATVGLRPLFAASLLNGKGGATFDGVDDRLNSTLAASAFKFLHDGTGGSIYAVFRTNVSAAMVLASTRGSAGTSRGLTIGTNTLFRAQTSMSDGVAIQASVTGASNSLATNKFDVYASRLASAASPDLRVAVNGVSVGSVDATAFSALDPAATLVLGANATPGAFLAGDVACLLAYAADQSDAELSALQDFFQQKYGVTFPV